MRVPSPHTTEYLSLSYTHSYPPPCYRLHCTDEILMVLLGRIMNMLVPGVVCMCACKGGGLTTHTYRGMQQTCTCAKTQCAFPPYSSSLFLCTLFLRLTQAQSDPAQIHLTSSFFYTPHSEIHTHTCTCHAGLYSTTSNTATDRKTHTLTHSLT